MKTKKQTSQKEKGYTYSEKEVMTIFLITVIIFLGLGILFGYLSGLDNKISQSSCNSSIQNKVCYNETSSKIIDINKSIIFNATCKNCPIIDYYEDCKDSLCYIKITKEVCR